MQSKDFRVGTVYAFERSGDFQYATSGVLLSTNRFTKSRRDRAFRASTDRPRLSAGYSEGVGYPTLRAQHWSSDAGKPSQADLRNKAREVLDALAKGDTFTEIDNALGTQFYIGLEIPSHFVGEWDIEQTRFNESQKLKAAADAIVQERHRRDREANSKVRDQIETLLGRATPAIFLNGDIRLPVKDLTDLLAKLSA